MKAEVDAEEVLRGMGVDWSRYTPPGGKEWREHFRTEMAPNIEREIANIDIHLATAKAAMAQNAEVARQMAETLKTVKSLVSSIGSARGISNDPHLATTAIALEDAAAALNARLSVLCNADADRLAVADFERDRNALAAFVSYVETDAELNKLLYAMHTVDIKYRNRILRVVLRLVKTVDEKRAELDHSVSPATKIIFDKMAEMFKNLDEAYAVLRPGLKQLKKAIEKKGEAAWRSISAVPLIARGLVPNVH